MAFADYTFFMWACQTVAGMVLLAAALASGAGRFFPAYFGYIGYCVVANLGAIVVIWAVGYDTRAHGLFQQACGWVSYGFLMLACFEAYRIVRVRRSTWIWAAMISVALFLAVGVAPQTVFDWGRLAQAALLHVELYFILAIMFQLWLNRGLQLGRNMAGILWSLSLIVSSQYMLVALVAVHKDFYWAVRWMMQPTFILGLTVPLFYLRGLDLPVLQAKQNSVAEES